MRMFRGGEGEKNHLWRMTEEETGVWPGNEKP